MKRSMLVIYQILAAIVLVGAVAVATSLLSEQPPARASSSADAVGAFGAISDLPYAGPVHANKLAGSAETVDANGIVHGVTPDGVSYVVYGRGQQGSSPDAVTLAAVGDVLGTTSNFPITDGYAGSMGDGAYDFEPYYQDVAGQIGTHDLRFINQETVCAGEEAGYSGYPVFNTPDASIEAIAATNFNIVNFNSNHTWDMGSAGIERSHELFAEYPQMMVIGSYASQEARDTVHLMEVNGTTFAFLSYLYADNFYGSDPDAFPNTYYSCPFDMDVMHEEIARAKTVADAVVVYMHWGSEYITEPNEQQWEYAQFLADEGVDLVIGSHAHILQPIRYVEGSVGNKVPVVFGLSDFISGWTLTDTILSGMFECDFVWEDGQLVVKNAQFTPAIEWSDGGDVTVRFLKDMSDEEIASNTRTEDVGDDVSYLHDFLDDLRMDVPVIW